MMSPIMKKSGAKSYALRIDSQLVKPLQELKKQNRRSLNAEINAALETWIHQAHSADTPHEEPSPTPPPAVAASGPREKRKSTRKRPAGQTEATPATPAAE
jgi:hypothetical protein